MKDIVEKLHELSNPSYKLADCEFDFIIENCISEITNLRKENKELKEEIKEMIYQIRDRRNFSN